MDKIMMSLKNIEKMVQNLMDFENYVRKNHHNVWYKARSAVGFNK